MNELARLRWRCRRGAREMDLLLERFLAEIYPDLDNARREIFERFLNEADPDMLSWINGRSVPADTGYSAIVEQLRGFPAQAKQ